MNERDMLLGRIIELTNELDIILNRLDDIDSNDPHYSAKKTLKAWGNIKDDNDMYKCIHDYVASLEATITENLLKETPSVNIKSVIDDVGLNKNHRVFHSNKTWKTVDEPFSYIHHAPDIIDNIKKEIELYETDEHYAAKLQINHWEDIISQTEVCKYVRSLETTITELREDVQSGFDKNNYQLQFQHDNYEKRIKQLERELEAEVMLKEIYREGVLKNRIYYCLKNSNGELYKYLFNVTAIFATWEEASFVAKHITDTGYEAQVYTGE